VPEVSVPKSKNPPEPKILVPPAIPPAPVPAAPVPTLKNPPPPKEDRFDQACREFAGDQEFEKRPPTREQVARAWALVTFRQTNESERPAHRELVAALKELFPEFKRRQAGIKPPAPKEN
jgi:hypothetical protein